MTGFTIDVPGMVLVLQAVPELADLIEAPGAPIIPVAKHVMGI